jgi:hypothetical protein
LRNDLFAAVRVPLMRSLTRQFAAWLVLGMHLFGFVCAPGLHYWQVSANPDCAALAGSPCHARCGFHHAPPAPADESEPESSQQRHDPDRCVLCKFFVNAKSLTVAVLQVPHSVACEELATSEPQRVYLDLTRAYLSRGPPPA